MNIKNNKFTFYSKEVLCFFHLVGYKTSVCVQFGEFVKTAFGEKNYINIINSHAHVFCE